MEEQHIVDENEPKKVRRRKKFLYNSIVQQMEFYFGDSNLTKDRFLSQLVQNDPFVDLSVFLKFNKIRNLTTNIEDLSKALRNSDKLEVSEDQLKVRRITPVQQKENQDECTIYVERLPADAEHDWLKNIFSKFGPVDYVSIPRYKHNRMIKGFAFVEFSAPESANNVLEYFDSIGCKLPTKMPPDQLASINTFEPENAPKETSSDHNKTVENETKDTDQQQADSSPSVKEEVPEETKIEEDTKTEKRKVEDETESEPKKVKLNDEIEQEQEADEKSEENEDLKEENGEKKKRKRKKSQRKKSQIIDLKQIGLQILSKKEWKQLRNKYLNLQRQKMQSLKEQLYRSRFASSAHNTENTTAEKTTPKSEEHESSPRFQFTPGSIIYFQLSQACVDIKKLKADIRAHSGVEFIDIEVGSNSGYLRFANKEAAEQFRTSDFEATMTCLSGEEETIYWNKITMDRDEKLKKHNGKKQRGRDKLLRKAEKELGKHIRFENAE